MACNEGCDVSIYDLVDLGFPYSEEVGVSGCYKRGSRFLLA
jgi:hypothetical protein